MNLKPNNINDFVKKLESLPVTKVKHLDGILSDLANHIYEIGENVDELQEKLNSKQKEELTKLEQQLISLNNLLYEIEEGYDSHYMDRARYTLSDVLKSVIELIKN